MERCDRLDALTYKADYRISRKSEANAALKLCWICAGFVLGLYWIGTESRLDLSDSQGQLAGLAASGSSHL